MCLDRKFTNQEHVKFLASVANQPLIKVYKVVRVKKRGFYPWLWSNKRIKSGKRRAYIISRAEERGWHAFLDREHPLLNANERLITCYAKPEWLRLVGCWAGRNTGIFTHLIFPKFPLTDVPHLELMI